MIYIGILLFFVLEYVRPSNFIPAMGPLNSAVPLTVALAAILSKGAVSNGDLMKEPTTRWLLFLFGLLLLSAVTADVTQRAVEILTGVTGYLLMFWTIAKTVRTRRQLVGIFFFLGVVHIIIAGLNQQLFTSDSRAYISAAPFLGDGNDYSLSLNVVIPLWLYLLSETRRSWQKLLFLGAILLLVFCVVLTQSRGGTLALLCVGAYYWVKSQQKVLTGFAAAAAIAVVFALSPPAYFERMGDMTNSEESSAQGRIQAWNGAVDMMLDNPILGVGAGHFAVMYGAKYGHGTGNKTAHSVYFLLLGELGIPGLAFIIGLIASNLIENRALARSIKERGESARSDLQLLAALSASLIAYAVGGAFLSAAYYPHVFVLSGLLIASRRVVRTNFAAVPVTTGRPREIELHWALRPRPRQAS